MQQRVVPSHLQGPPGGPPDRLDNLLVPVQLVGDHGHEPLELAEHHRLAERRLGAELVVDGLPADAPPPGHLSHSPPGTARPGAWAIAAADQRSWVVIREAASRSRSRTPVVSWAAVDMPSSLRSGPRK